MPDSPEPSGLERLRGGPVTVDLTLRGPKGPRAGLKFNMLSSTALSRKLGQSNPLAALLRPQSVTDALLLVLAAGCLHAGGGHLTKEEVDQLVDGALEPDDVAQRLSVKFRGLIDHIDGQPFHDAIAEALELGSSIPRCSACKHRFGQHHWLGDCREDDCRCNAWHPHPQTCVTCRHDASFHAGEDKADPGCCTEPGCECDELVLRKRGKDAASPMVPATSDATPSPGESSTASPPSTFEEVPATGG